MKINIMIHYDKFGVLYNRYPGSFVEEMLEIKWLWS